MLEVYNAREDDFVEAMSLEMGAPLAWARGAQFWAGQVHIESTIKAAEGYALGIDARQYPDRARGHRGLRADHAVELADEPDRLQGGPGASWRAAPWC